MCSRSCTGVFSEPTYGLKVSFVYVYKTRLLLYKATTLQSHSSRQSVVTLLARPVFLALDLRMLSQSAIIQMVSRGSHHMSLPAGPPLV